MYENSPAPVASRLVGLIAVVVFVATVLETGDVGALGSNAFALDVGVPPEYGTRIEGKMESDETWTKDNSPYVVTDDLIVTTGVTLTIEAGVQVHIEWVAGIHVLGTLFVHGESTDPVIFTSDVVFGSDHKGVTVTGGEATIHHGIFAHGSACLRLLNAKAVTVSGGIFHNCEVGIFISGGDPGLEPTTSIEFADIHNNAEAGIRIVDAMVRISNSDIHHNDGVGIDIVNTHEEKVNDASMHTDASFHNLLVHNNQQEGIHIWDQRRNAKGKVIVTHSLFANNAGGVFIRQNSATGTFPLFVSNSIFTQNKGFGVERFNHHSAIFTSNTAVWKQTPLGLILGDTVSKDPLFADASTGNYRLRSSSPLIDRGSAVESSEVDFDGLARRVDGNGDKVFEPDIGPFEYQPLENRPPVARIADVGVVTVNHEITLDGSPSYDPEGAITAWEWDFGDGTQATGRTVRHTFGDGADPSVTLTVVDEDDVKTSETFVIEVNIPPMFNREFDEIVEFEGIPIEFDVTAASDPDGTIVRYLWSFDWRPPKSGGVHGGPTASRTYANPGDYTARISIRDDDGADTTQLIPIKIIPQDLHSPTIADPVLLATFPQGDKVPVNTFPEGENITVETQVVDASGVDWVRLHFRQLGSDDGFTTIDMEADESNYRVLLSADVVGAPGVEFWIEAKDKGGPAPNTGRFPSEKTLEIPIFGSTEIVSEPIEEPMLASHAVTVQATVTPASPSQELLNVFLYYQVPGKEDFQFLFMKQDKGQWLAKIPAFQVRPQIIRYYIVATEKAPLPWHRSGGRWPGGDSFATIAVEDVDAPVISHTPPPTQEEEKAFTLTAEVTDNISVASVVTHLRNSDGTFTPMTMTSQEGSRWSVDIPSDKVRAPGVTYYIEATDTAASPQTSTYPINAPKTLATVQVKQADKTGPAISEISLSHVPVEETEVTIRAKVTDKSGLDKVFVHYRDPDGVEKFIAMANIAGDTWSADIPGADVLRPRLEYWLKAQDTLGNKTTAPEVAPDDVFSTIVKKDFSLAAGDLVITEIMYRPLGGDKALEWFEVYNPTKDPVDIDGVVLKDDGEDAFVIGKGKPLVIQPETYFVFGKTDEEDNNGGVPVDYVYSDIVLDDQQDEIILKAGDVEVDRVAYSAEAMFPTTAGYAMSLDPQYRDVQANDKGENWCDASTQFGDSAMFGTPGVKNPSCEFLDEEAPQITVGLIPDGQVEGRSVKITAVILDVSKVPKALLYFRLQGEQDFQSVAMEEGTDNAWVATIPPDAVAPTKVEYYVQAQDIADNVATAPLDAPSEVYSFLVSETDRSGPTIVVQSMGNQQENIPVTIEATITDAEGVKSARLLYRPQGQQAFLTIPMAQKKKERFSATIPANRVIVSTIDYYVEATDNNGNVSRNPASDVLQLRVVEEKDEEVDLEVSGGGCYIASGSDPFGSWFIGLFAVWPLFRCRRKHLTG